MRYARIAAALAALGTLGAGAIGALGVSAAHASASTTVRTPRCTNADLSASYTYKDSGAGHRFGWIVLKNVSDHTCRTGGFGGISYVGHGDGTQIGAAADRDGKAYVLLVKPGHRIRSLVDQVDAGIYSKKTCRPTHVDGFRVYVPNATKSQYVAAPWTGCANAKIHLLSHRSYRHP